MVSIHLWAYPEIKTRLDADLKNQPALRFIPAPGATGEQVDLYLTDAQLRDLADTINAHLIENQRLSRPEQIAEALAGR